jgi:hypothetical protein
MRTLGIGAVAFLAGYVVCGVAFWGLLFLVSGRFATTTRREWIDDAAVGIYLMIVMAALNAAAFTLVAAASRNWRRRPARRAASASAVLGAVAAFLTSTGAWVLPALVFGKALGAGPAVGLGFVSPGILSGLLALAWARLSTAAADRPQVAAPGSVE